MKHLPDPMIVETVDRLFASACDGACIAATENGEPAQRLWAALEASAIPRAWMPDALGGADASLADVCAIVRTAGGHAAPVPLADTLLAGHLAAAHGMMFDHGMHALACTPPGEAAPGLSGGRLVGHRTRVPFARFAKVILLCAQGEGRDWLAMIDAGAARIGAGTSLAGEPLDSVELEGVTPLELRELDAGWSANGLWLAGALMRAQMMSGALARILAMSVDYAKERHAFGRPIAGFQAVQHNLAMLAAEVAAAVAAANGAMLAASAHGFGDGRTEWAVASAKVRVGEAAGAGAAIAHQVHGAMGFTREHRLHQLTRRLWSWRDEYGQESEWAMRLGRRVAAAGADALWPALTAD